MILTHSLSVCLATEPTDLRKNLPKAIASPWSETCEKLCAKQAEQREKISSDVQADPEKWRRIGEEIREQIEKEPGYFYILLTIRPKYVHIDEPQRAPIISPACH